MINADLIVDKDFPPRTVASIEGVSNVNSYMACPTCKTKNTGAACHKCGSTEDPIKNFVAKIFILHENKLEEKTIFHYELVKFIGIAKDEEDAEDRLFDLIDDKIKYSSTGEIMFGIELMDNF